MFNSRDRYKPRLCFCVGGSPSSSPPPPPPPPPEAAPVQFGADTTDLVNKVSKHIGKKKLQIPLTPAGGATGLGIPSP